MAMLELISGGAACAVPGSSSSSNPLGALANALIGSSSKTQERLQEIPTGTATASNGNLHAGVEEPFAAALPGSEHEYSLHPNAQGSEFLRGFRTMDQSGFSDAWDDIQRPQIPHYLGRAGPSNSPLEHLSFNKILTGHLKKFCSIFCTPFFIVAMVACLFVLLHFLF